MTIKCASLTMLQNEADIVEYFIRSNLQFLDHMFIVSSPSSDGTREILEKLVGARLPITVWKTERNLYSQREMISWFTIYLREFLRPKFLFVMDADEILLASDKYSFEDSLSKISSGHVGAIEWRTFLPDPKSNYSKFSPDNFRMRLSEELMKVQKTIIPEGVEIHEAHPFDYGTHYVFGSDREVLPCTELQGIEVAHLPVRSIEQIREKSAAAPLSRAMSHGTNWRGKQSFQYDIVWKLLQQSPQPSIKEIAENYLNKDLTRTIPAAIRDERLPDIKLRFDTSRLPRGEGALYRQLVDRLAHTAFATTDPTASLKSALEEKIHEAQELDDELPSGAFSILQHAKSLKCDWPPIELALDRFTPNKLLDLGCGLGAYLHLAKRNNIEVFGVDGSPWSQLHFIPESTYLQHDLSIGPPSLDAKFDTSMCLEVLEHLPEDSGLAIIQWLSKNTIDGIIFSAARPNQPGHQHITCREPEFWLDAFAKNGWSVDPAATIALRLLSTLHWFRCNIFVLQPGTQKESEKVSHILSLPHPQEEWPDQGGNSKIFGFPGAHPLHFLDGPKKMKPFPILDSDNDVEKYKIESASQTVKIKDLSTMIEDLELQLEIALMDSSARKSKLAEKIDKLDYLVHLGISQLPLSKSIREKFRRAAERRRRQRYSK